jgi:hypothetical protein
MRKALAVELVRAFLALCPLQESVPSTSPVADTTMDQTTAAGV